jgi:hypothetical protein
MSYVPAGKRCEHTVMSEIPLDSSYIRGSEAFSPTS